MDSRRIERGGRWIKGRAKGARTCGVVADSVMGAGTDLRECEAGALTAPYSVL